MRIIFHQRAIAGKKTGVGVYTSCLLKALRAHPGTHELDCFPEGWLWRAYAAWAHVEPWWFQLQSQTALGRQRWLASLKPLSRTALHFCRYAGRELLDRRRRSVFPNGRYDVYHEPNQVPLQTDLPTVVTLHDLSVLLYPGWHPKRRVHWFDRHFHRTLTQCQHFITVSNTVRRHVIQFLGIPASRVSCVYHGVSSHYVPLPGPYTDDILRRLGLKRGYLLYLGTIEPRKNILMLMQAYCALPARLRERSPLVLGGTWGWGFEEVADYYYTKARHEGVRHVGYLSEEYLPALYNGARCLVYPSVYEGFGLPCLEMMACGGAVVASTADVFQETIGGQAYLVPPNDASAWRKTLARIIEDDDWHRMLQQGSTDLAATYTWENCADKTLEVYERACERPVSRARLSQAA
jgi:alpha-1,3-rhamnosyl/mannosyltransferase